MTSFESMTVTVLEAQYSVSHAGRAYVRCQYMFPDGSKTRDFMYLNYASRFLSGQPQLSTQTIGVDLTRYLPKQLNASVWYEQKRINGEYRRIRRLVPIGEVGDEAVEQKEHSVTDDEVEQVFFQDVAENDDHLSCTACGYRGSRIYNVEQQPPLCEFCRSTGAGDMLLRKNAPYNRDLVVIFATGMNYVLDRIDEVEKKRRP